MLELVAGDTDTLARLRACRAPANEALAIPAPCYSDPDWFAKETDKLFIHGWVGIGRADRWAEPGDYAALDIAGTPVIVVRGKAGALTALANSCRHRGARLVSNDGNCRGFRCPFHAWAYRLDGSLAAAPNMELSEIFDKQQFGLRRFQAAERAGFAFVNLGTSPQPIDEVLGGFEAVHAPWRLDQLVTTRRREFDVKCNWKPFLEVFNEYYHLPFVHSNSLGGLYAPPDAAEEAEGSFASQFGETDGSGALLRDEQDKALPPASWLAGRNARGVRYTWAFPNMAFAANAEALWVYDVLPLTPSACRVGMSACFPKETAARQDFEEKVQPYYQRLDKAIAEDIEMLEEQQIGLQSRFAETGPFSPLLEANVARFANWYAGKFLEEQTQ